MASTPRLVVVSNRLPVTIARTGGTWSLSPSSGGLVSALAGLRRTTSFVWVGWPGFEVAPEDEEGLCSALASFGAEGTAEARPGGAEAQCVPVFLQNADAYYNGFANGTLWPLLHYLPRGVVFSDDEWAAYVAANRAFASVVARVARPGDCVWVHDYHLMLLPAMLRAARADVRIGFFLHTPFPSSEVYRALPVRRELVRGVLDGADLVGFHTPDYARHFLATAARLCPGVEVGPTGAVLEGGEAVRVGVFPIGIDPAAFASVLARPDVQRRVSALLRTRSSIRADATIGEDNTLSDPTMNTSSDPKLNTLSDPKLNAPDPTLHTPTDIAVIAPVTTANTPTKTTVKAPVTTVNDPVTTVNRPTKTTVNDQSATRHSEESSTNDFKGTKSNSDATKMAKDATESDGQRTDGEWATRRAPGDELPSDAPIILGVDRLDYIKGVPHKLLAFERLLESHPACVGRVSLLQIAVPTRTDVDEYRALRAAVEAHVGRINGRWGTPAWTPVHYVFRAVPFAELAALYRAADVLAVSSTRDGMNLVSHEFVAAHAGREPPGALVLSEFAGAAQSLGGAAIVANPWSVADLAHALWTALRRAATPAEARAAHARMMRYVSRHTAAHWGAAFVRALASRPLRAPAHRALPWDAAAAGACFDAGCAVVVVDWDAAALSGTPRRERVHAAFLAAVVRDMRAPPRAPPTVLGASASLRSLDASPHSVRSVRETLLSSDPLPRRVDAPSSASSHTSGGGPRPVSSLQSPPTSLPTSGGGSGYTTTLPAQGASAMSGVRRASASLHGSGLSRPSATGTTTSSSSSAGSIGEETVFVVASRKGRGTLDTLFPPGCGVGLVAENGLYARLPAHASVPPTESLVWQRTASLPGAARPVADIDDTAVAAHARALLPLLAYYTQHTPGAAVVPGTDGTLAWSYAAADAEFGAFQAADLLEDVAKALRAEAPGAGIDVRHAARHVEIVPRGASTAGGVQAVLATLASCSRDVSGMLASQVEDTSDAQSAQVQGTTAPGAPVAPDVVIGDACTPGELMDTGRYAIAVFEGMRAPRPVPSAQYAGDDASGCTTSAAHATHRFDAGAGDTPGANVLEAMGLRRLCRL